MIIGIDGNEANVARRVGIGEYAFELLSQFSNAKFNPPAGGQHSSIKYQIYLKEQPLPHMPEESDTWKYRIVGPKRFWTQFGLPISLFTKRDIDVFFSPTHYAPRFSPVPTIISVMDLSYVHFPELFNKRDLYQLKQWTAYSIRNAVKVFTISQASKNDIMKEYNVADSKVVVTYLGKKQTTHSKEEKIDMNEVMHTYGIEGDYILFVGTLQPRKNIERLIEAFSLLEKKTKKSLSLVIVGKKGWLYEPILAAPKRFGVVDAVRFLDFVDDTTLATLYKNASCFVFPSLYEGFGFPILEAMTHGCPVVASNVSSIPEVGGDAVLYIDPYNVKDIAEKIEQVISDKKVRDTLVAKGRKQVQKFSWEKTAKETLQVIEQVGKTV